MSKSWIAVAAASLGSGVVAGVFVGRWPSAPDVPVGPGVLAESREVVAQGADGLPLLARLDDMSRRLQAIERRLDAFPGAPAPMRESAAPAAVPGPTTTPTTVTIDVDSLQRALEQIEQKKLDAMTDDELLRGARISGKGGDNTAEAVRRLRALLERPLSPEKRNEVLVDLGVQLRAQGTEDALTASAATLQGVVDAQGLGTKTGRAAAYQLIWTCAEQKDSARGIAMARAYSDAPGASAHQRIEGRWAAAILVHGSGDVVNGRREYEVLLRDIGDAPEFAKLAADLRQRLGKP